MNLHVCLAFCGNSIGRRTPPSALPQVDAKNKYGKTARDIAAESGFNDDCTHCASSFNTVPANICIWN